MNRRGYYRRPLMGAVWPESEEYIPLPPGVEPPQPVSQLFPLPRGSSVRLTLRFGGARLFEQSPGAVNNFGAGVASCLRNILHTPRVSIGAGAVNDEMVIEGVTLADYPKADQIKVAVYNALIACFPYVVVNWNELHVLAIAQAQPTPASPGTGQQQQPSADDGDSGAGIPWWGWALIGGAALIAFKRR